VIKRKPRLTAAGVRVLAAQHRKRMESLLAVDDLVGALLDKLAAQGELRNTYFVFTSDNGWYSGEHRLTAKSFPYEEGASIPLIVRGPGVPSGVSVPHLVGMHDMAPTIAAIGGTRPSRVVDGKSFKPLLSAERPAPGSWRKALLIENVDDKARYWAVRQQTRLYAEHRETRTLEREHYYLLKDPYQLRSTHYSLSQGMRDRLHDKLVKLRACDGRECRAAEGR
jgi:N-acetylglucosamine-6-sulfatase